MKVGFSSQFILYDIEISTIQIPFGFLWKIHRTIRHKSNDIN